MQLEAFACTFAASADLLRVALTPSWPSTLILWYFWWPKRHVRSSKKTKVLTPAHLHQKYKNRNSDKPNRKPKTFFSLSGIAYSVLWYPVDVAKKVWGVSAQQTDLTEFFLFRFLNCGRTENKVLYRFAKRRMVFWRIFSRSACEIEPWRNIWLLNRRQ